MRRTKARPVNRRGEKGDRAARIGAWWDAVVAGATDEPHPVHGYGVSARLTGEKLVLAGEVGSRRERSELLKEARTRIGHGFRQVDSSRLRVDEHPEKPGLLDQTLIATFPDSSTAALASKFVMEHSRVTPKEMAIIDRTNLGKLRGILPRDYLEDATKRIERREAVLVLRVDETEVFKVRGLLEEDTRSTWTVTTPPQLASGSKR
jgi:hypothetical protein